MAVVAGIADDAFMNWPAPTEPPVTVLTPSEDRSPAASSRHRSRTARPLAAWLAVTGAALLMVAAVVVVASSWQSISAIVRCALLVAAVTVVFVAAEHLRPATPVTAKVVAHLAPLLLAPAGIAAAATLHQSWRVCIIAGGAAAALGAEGQRRRWQLPLLVEGSVAAGAFAAAGAGALVHLPVGVIVAVAAVLLAPLSRRHALSAATVAAAGPILAVVAAGKVGPGTIAELGASGRPLVWAAPVAGLLAAMVIGREARVRHSPIHAVAALTAAVFGALTGMAVGATPASLWACVPAAALLLVEALHSRPADSVWGRLVPEVSLTRSAAAAAAFATALAVLAWQEQYGARSWLLPLGMSAVAVTVSAVLTWREARAASPQSLAAVLLVAATAQWAGTPRICVAVGLCAVAAIIGSQRPRHAWVAVGSAVAGSALLTLAGPWSWWPLGLLALVSITAAGLGALAAAQPAIASDGGLLALVLALPVLAADLSVTDRLAGVAVLLVVGTVAVSGRPQAGRGVALAAGMLAFVGETTPWTAPAAVCLAAVGTLWWCRRLPERHLAGVELVVALGMAAHAAGLSDHTIATAALFCAIALAGLAFTTERVTLLDTASVTCTATALVLSVGHRGVLPSLALLAAGSQAAAYGLARRQRLLTVTGGATMSAGLLSLWWTTAVGHWALHQLAPLGVTGSDVAVLSAAAALLAAGAVVGHVVDLHSLVTASPGMALLMTWLFGAQTRTDGTWAAVLSLALGVAFTGLGANRRSGAYLLGGTTLLATTILLSSGSRLSSVPGWLWMLLGGVALIALASLVERSAKNDQTASVREMLHRLR